MAKWVYLFSEGNANMRELLGGKGALVQHTAKHDGNDNDCQQQPHCSSRHDYFPSKFQHRRTFPFQSPTGVLIAHAAAYPPSYLTFGCPAGMLLLYAELTL